MLKNFFIFRGSDPILALSHDIKTISGVKLTLYQGLYEVVVRNGALCGAVLDMLHHHVILSGINRPNSINPIDLDEIITEEGGEPLVKVS